jgi:hypothetical protein
MPAELPAPGEEEIDVTDVDIDEPEEEPSCHNSWVAAADNVDP